MGGIPRLVGSESVGEREGSARRGSPEAGAAGLHGGRNPTAARGGWTSEAGLSGGRADRDSARRVAAIALVGCRSRRRDVVGDGAGLGVEEPPGSEVAVARGCGGGAVESAAGGLGTVRPDFRREAAANEPLPGRSEGGGDRLGRSRERAAGLPQLPGDLLHATGPAGGNGTLAHGIDAAQQSPHDGGNLHGCADAAAGGCGWEAGRPS